MSPFIKGIIVGSLGTLVLFVVFIGSGIWLSIIPEVPPVEPYEPPRATPPQSKTLPPQTRTLRPTPPPAKRYKLRVENLRMYMKSYGYGAMDVRITNESDQLLSLCAVTIALYDENENCVATDNAQASQIPPNESKIDTVTFGEMDMDKVEQWEATIDVIHSDSAGQIDEYFEVVVE